MICGYKGIRPTLGAHAFVDVSAQVIGDVELGDDASIWMSHVGCKETCRVQAEEGR